MIGTMLFRHPTLLPTTLISLEGNLALADCGKSLEVAKLTEEEFYEIEYPKLKASLAASSEPSSKLRFQALSKIPDFVFLRTSKSIVEYSKSEELLKLFLQGEIPTLLILGENGTFSSRPSSAYIQTVNVSDAGHFMIIDNPKETLDLISNFLHEALG